MTSSVLTLYKLHNSNSSAHPSDNSTGLSRLGGIALAHLQPVSGPSLVCDRRTWSACSSFRSSPKTPTSLPPTQLPPHFYSTFSAMETNYTASLGPAIDLSHHVSEIAKARRFSPLKVRALSTLAWIPISACEICADLLPLPHLVWQSFAKYMMDPSVRSLAGGLPHPGFFPFETLSSMTLKPDAYQPAGVAPKQVRWLEKLLGSNLTSIEVPKYGKTRAELQLSSGLQYGAASGFAELTAFLREWTSVSPDPPLPLLRSPGLTLWNLRKSRPMTRTCQSLLDYHSSGLLQLGGPALRRID